MKRKRRLLRFRTVEIISLIIFSLVAMMATLSICNRDYSRALVKKYSESRSDIIYQVQEKVAQTYKGANTLSNSYYYSDYLDTIAESSQNYLNQKAVTFKGNMKSLDMSAMNLMLAYDFEYYIVIKFDNGYSYISKNKYLSSYDYDKWFQEDHIAAWTAKNGKLSLSGPYVDELGEEENRILVFGRTFFGSFHTEKGYILVCIPEEEVSKTYETVAKNSDIYLVDAQNKIISSNNKKYLGGYYTDLFEKAVEGRIISEGEEHLVTSSYDEETGITVIEHYPYKHIVSATREVYRHVLMAVALMCGIIILFSVVYANIMSRKLRKLSEEVEKVGEHHLDVAFSGEGWYEIAQIALALTSMQERIKNLIRETKEKERKKRKAEINFLQLQMNPHVIYNTIFCAKCLVDMEKNEDASYMLSKFIDYLRWMFNSSGKNLTVAEAVAHLNQYIDIMKYRYTDNFEVIYQIQEDTENAYMINMLLQPIVENAILHGIAPCEEKCILVIRTERRKEQLVVTVCNDGVAMTPEEVREYEKQLQDEEQKHGMNNVLSRLKTTYGEQYELQISSNERETKVMIVIPYITEQSLEEKE